MFSLLRKKQPVVLLHLHLEVAGHDPITAECSIKVNMPVTINTEIHFANDQPSSQSKDKCSSLQALSAVALLLEEENALKNLDCLSLEVSHVSMA